MKARYLAMLSVIVIMIQPIAIIPASAANPTMTFDIFDGYYEDVDNNGVFDVIVKTRFDLTGVSSGEVEYVIVLTLPSGRDFIYVVQISTPLTSFIVTNTFYDHALESGWYTVEIYARLSNFRNVMGYDSLTFDPPGSDNTDPGDLGTQVSGP